MINTYNFVFVMCVLSCISGGGGDSGSTAGDEGCLVAAHAPRGTPPPPLRFHIIMLRTCLPR